MWRVVELEQRKGNPACLFHSKGCLSSPGGGCAGVSSCKSEGGVSVTTDPSGWNRGSSMSCRKLPSRRKRSITSGWKKLYPMYTLIILTIPTVMALCPDTRGIVTFVLYLILFYLLWYIIYIYKYTVFNRPFLFLTLTAT